MHSPWHSVASSRNSVVSTRSNTDISMMDTGTDGSTSMDGSHGHVHGRSHSHNPLRKMASQFMMKKPVRDSNDIKDPQDLAEYQQQPKSRTSSPEPSKFRKRLSRKKTSSNHNNALLEPLTSVISHPVEVIDFETLHNHDYDDISSCSSLGWDADEYEASSSLSSTMSTTNTSPAASSTTKSKLDESPSLPESLTEFSRLSLASELDVSVVDTETPQKPLKPATGFKNFSFSVDCNKPLPPKPDDSVVDLDPLAGSTSPTPCEESYRTSLVSIDDTSSNANSSMFRKESKASAFSIQTKSSATESNLDKIPSTSNSLQGSGTKAGGFKTSSLTAPSSRRVSLATSMRSNDTKSSKESKEATHQTQQETWYKFLQFSQRSRASDPIIYAKIRKEAWLQYNDHLHHPSHHHYRNQTNKRNNAGDKDIIFEFWLVQALRLLYSNKLLFSRPAINKVYNTDKPTTVLEVQGAMQDFWAWQLAIDHPDATIYGFKFHQGDGFQGTTVNYEGPLNYIPFIGHSLQKMPFEDNFFDVVSAKSLWYNIRADDWVPTLKELNRVLKPGGVIEISLMDFGLLNDDVNASSWQLVKKGLHYVNIDTEPLEHFPEYAAKAGFEVCKRALIALPKGWGGNLGHVTDFLYSYMFDTGLAALANVLPADTYKQELNVIRKSVLSNSNAPKDANGNKTDPHRSGMLALHYLTKPAEVRNTHIHSESINSITNNNSHKQTTSVVVPLRIV